MYQVRQSQGKQAHPTRAEALLINRKEVIENIREPLKIKYPNCPLIFII